MMNDSQHSNRPPQGTEHDDAGYLEHAISLALDSVGTGGGPFGALVVREGSILATGQNRVTVDNDPTAHAEVSAIRAACAQLGTFALEGCTLYTSCEPCPLCLAASMWARLQRVVFSANRHDAARGGFDDTAFYQMFAQDSRSWAQPVVDELRLSGSTQPFQTWLAHTRRVDY